MLIRLLLLFFVPVSLTFAQSAGTVLVKAGDDVSKVIPRKDKYRYEEFLDGQLYYPQGQRSDVMKLNYNILVGAMQFIDHNGDTLYIAEDSNIFRYIQIHRDLYYHDFTLGYFEILTREDPIKLLAQRKWKIIRKEVVVNNGYGNSSSVSNTEYSSRRSEINNFIQNENSLFGKDLSYFLLGKRDKIYKANKAGFIKAFAEHKNKIKQYLNEQEVDLNNEDDLKALLAFCCGIENT